MFSLRMTGKAVVASLILAGLSGGMAIGAVADEPLTPEELWLETDLDAINEGELEFLATPPKQPVHYLINQLTIDSSSLEDGWVGLRQCHENLDAVPDAEIVYRYRTIRDLRVLSSSGIGKAYIEGQSVQLKNVRRGAELCVEAEVRILERDGKTFVLRNGPFHRRFLDGYYPMHVTVTVQHPHDLESRAVLPPAQSGFSVERSSGKLTLDAWFAGRLEIEMRFSEPGSLEQGRHRGK